MKKSFIMAVCCVASLFASCQQEEIENEIEKLKVSIEAAIGNAASLPKGRYVGDEPNGASFGANDEIGLSVNGGNFVKWTCNGSKWSPVGESVYWTNKTDKHKFYAFYPYNSPNGMSLSNVPMPDLSKQNGQMADVAKHDFLAAEKEQTYGTDGVVSFTEEAEAPFGHISSLIQIKIKGDGDLGSATIDSILIEGTGVTTLSTYSFESKEVKLDATNASNKMIAKDLNRQMNSSDQLFYFILNAGTVNLTDMSLTIGYTSGGKKYKAKLQGMGSANAKLERGKLYSYTLKISDGVLTISGNEIKDWESGESMDDIVINGEEQA